MSVAFLAERTSRPWQTTVAGFEILGYHLGQGTSPQLEVVVASAPADRTTSAIRSLWKVRHGGRQTAVLLVVVHPETGKVSLCGPIGIKDDPPVHPTLDFGQAERVCTEALDQPNREGALRYLRDALPALQSASPGVRNEGFLATYTVARMPQEMSIWPKLTARGRQLAGLTDTKLLTSLGFDLTPLDNLSTLLRASGTKSRIGVAIVLNPGESFDLEADRLNGLSPVTYAMTKAGEENLRFVLVCQGPRVRLYSVAPQPGVAGRSRTETFLEIHTGLLRDEHVGYLWALLSAEALCEGGTFDELLAKSKLYAAHIAERLRERVYDVVIPKLAEGLVLARKLKKPTALDLADTYRMAMTVLFRLLFVAYAEDKDLLPYRWNGLYRKRSLKAHALELKELHDASKPFDSGDSLWAEVDKLFQAVAFGNREWGVPEYGGDLFDRNEAEYPLNAALAKLTLPNTLFGIALNELLLNDTPEGRLPVDFKTLGVREFGTVYEGLLESELAVAESDLITDAEGNYRPCKKGDTPVKKKGDIYLHNKSGQRKATGTYFTKPFAVDHLLDEALEPALLDHFARLDKLDDIAAAERFFDFRVADIAMGSAHFLVAAVDRIERAFSMYLAKRPLAGVKLELATLRAAAEDKLKSLLDVIDEQRLEPAQLLRRQIARRCIYGVDRNEVAVSLARLSIWIHTFVPGLPLSLLNHTLREGNSLVGIGRVSEISEKIDQRDTSGLFQMDAETLIGKALEPLQRLAKLNDATIADVNRAKSILKEAETAVAPASAICDIASACRITGENFPAILFDDWETEQKKIVGSKRHKEARAALAHLPAFHFPVAFPEVFLRERSGFDVLLGNPPWEKVRVEEHAFWSRHFPGTRSLSQREREAKQAEFRKDRPDLAELLIEEVAETDTLRSALLQGPYPGMGSGDPDLYKAFCWRFWHLCAEDRGRLGIVLPRSAMAAKGSELFRQAVFAGSADVTITMVINNKGWVFTGVHPQYTVGLIEVCRGKSVGESIGLRGPFNSIERFQAGHCSAPIRFASSDVVGWTDTASLPLLPAEESLSVFARLRQQPRFDLNDGTSWRARPYRELDATNDKPLMDVESEEKPSGFWPVYKGESFDTWEPDGEVYYAWADPKKVLPELVATQKRGSRSKASPFSEFPKERIGKKELLPCMFARIAFRDVTRATDTRTVRCALIPPKVFLVHTAPCMLFPRGHSNDVAYLLGVLSSIPLDWYARRFVEIHMTYGVLNPFPIPRPVPDDPLWKRVVQLAGRLAAVDDRYAAWAKEVGVACGPLDDATKTAHIVELDAVVAHLYGLSEAQLIHVFETFHEGWDYHDRLAATLTQFKKWASK